MIDEGASRAETVRALIAEVIGEPELSLVDDFFAAGGHSLLIVRVVRRLKVEHGLVLDPRAFAANAQILALAGASTPAAAENRN